MPRSPLIACCLVLAACGARSTFHDYSTPEAAARSFVEAGRVGDMHSVRQSLVAAERDQDVECDYAGLDAYELVRDQAFDADHVAVLLRVGEVSSPLACQREAGEWRVTIHGSLALMRQMLHDQPAAAPR